jgi:hypothetical protein
MAARFSSLPPLLVWFLSIGAFLSAVAIPFGRRNDWLGWIALLLIAFFAICIWAMLIIGITKSVLAWYRDKPGDADDSEVGQCYDEYVHKISWDQERFSLKTSDGDTVVDVPLSNLLDVIDTDALFMENEVKFSSPQIVVAFPKSRSARAKIIRLMRSLSQRDLHVRQGVEDRRKKMFHQGAKWLPLSLVVAGTLILLAVITPDPKHVNLIWLAAGIAYSLAWYWVLWRFAYSVASLSASRELKTIVKPSEIDSRRLKRPT